MTRKKFFDILPPESQNVFPKGIPTLSFEKTTSKKSPQRKTTRSKRVLIFLFFFLSFLLVGSYFTLAKVKIEIWPKTETLNFTEKITVDSNASQIDFSAKTIPAQILETEETASQEFPSSGKIEKLAEGKIRVYNKYYLPVTLRAQTRFQPNNKEVLYFCSLSRTSISAKSFVDIQVKACFVKSGESEKYNIGPSKFSVPGLSGNELFFYVYGESFELMKGGGEVSQVAKEDIEKAKDILTQTLFAKLDESLKKKISTDSIFLDKATKKEIIEIVPNAEVGAEVNSFELNAKARLKTIVFRKPDLENLAKEIISTQIPQDKKIQDGSLKFDYQPESIDLEKGKIVLDTQISAKIFSDINLKTLKETLIGKSFQESKTILENRADVVKAQISAWPFWLGRLPKNTEKIEFKINVD